MPILTYSWPLTLQKQGFSFLEIFYVFFVLSSAARSSTFCVISLLGCGVHQVPQLFPAFQEGVYIYKKLYSEPESWVSRGTKIEVKERAAPKLL